MQIGRHCWLLRITFMVKLVNWCKNMISTAFSALSPSRKRVVGIGYTSPPVDINNPPEPQFQGCMAVTGTTGVVLTTPAGDTSTAAVTHTIFNSGNAPIDWEVTSTQTWVKFLNFYVFGPMQTSMSGTLNPGESYNLIALIDTSLADAFPPGLYSAFTQFSNETNECGNTTNAYLLTLS